MMHAGLKSHVSKYPCLVPPWVVSLPIVHTKQLPRDTVGRDIFSNANTKMDIKKILAEAQTVSRKGRPVLVNCLIGRTDFREGSISV